MHLNNIKLAIFDNSGVLNDDRLPVYEANMRLLEKYDLGRIAFEEWLKLSKASVGDLLTSLGAKVPKEEISKEYERIYTEITTRKTNPVKPKLYSDVPYVLRILREKKNLKLAIVSTHPKSNLIKELNENNIAGFFDEVSGDPSPKTERLQTICQRFGISTKESIFVEDTVFGLRSGYKAGVICFAVTTGYHSRERLEAEEKAIAVIDSLTEILDYL